MAPDAAVSPEEQAAEKAKTLLLQSLRDRFTLQELRDLVLGLALDFELFLCDKSQLTRALLSRFEHKDKLGCLISEVLKRRRDEQLARLLPPLPPCQPRSKIQISIPAELLKDAEGLKQDLATLFAVSPPDVSIIAAAWGSVRLLVGLPAAAGNVRSLSRLHSVQNTAYGSVSVIAFASLDIISQKTWQLIACEYPPLIRRGKLNPTISWQDALRQISQKGSAIYLAHPYAPSALLYTADLPSFVQSLLERAREHRQAGNWEQAEHCAVDAQRYFEQMQDNAGIAISLIHLADIYRERGQTDILLANAHKARQLLQLQPTLAQRHNEAVAAYNLGLVHYLLGCNSKALECHRSAQKGFEKARKQIWMPQRAFNWATLCATMVERLDAISDALAHPAALPRKKVGSSNDTFSTAHLRDSDYILGQQLTIGATTYQVYALTSGDVTFIPDGEYHVIKAPPQAHLLIGAQAGDYVLARQTRHQDPLVPYYVTQAAGEVTLGRFERDPENSTRMRFVSLEARLIGTAEDRPSFYHPIALLRPTDKR